MENEENATWKQKAYLKKLGVAEAELQGMSKQQAAKRIEELLAKQPKHTQAESGQSNSGPKAEREVSERLALAVTLIAKRFGISEDSVKFDSPLLAEVMHELYGSLWLKDAK